MAKAEKKGAKKYDEKLAVKGSFDDVIKVSAAENPEPAAKPIKPRKSTTK